MLDFMQRMLTICVFLSHYSIRRLYELFDEDSIVLSGHTTPTFLKKERIANPFVDMALRRPFEWYSEAKEHHGWNDDAI